MGAGITEPERIGINLIVKRAEFLARLKLPFQAVFIDIMRLTPLLMKNEK